jgi:tRNA threonylcarbamoyladenosine biosynthesis protein TsaB
MPHLLMPRAANVAMLGLSEFAKGKSDHAMQLEPVYIRRSEAEVLWERRNGKSEE